MATRKQVAARKLFSQRSKAGVFARSLKKKQRQKNPLTVAAIRKGARTAVRRTKAAIQTGHNAVQRGRNALKSARDLYHALHPGKPLPPSLASKKKRRQKNPLHFVVFTKRAYGENWIQARSFPTKAKAFAFASLWRGKHPNYGVKVLSA